MKIFNHALAALALAASCASQAALVPTPLGPYSHLDSAYTASVYATDTNQTYTLGVAFVGNLLIRSSDSGTLFVDNGTTSVVHGATVHNFTTHTVGGAGWNNRGIVGHGGFLYGNTGGGLRKIDINTFTSTILPNSVGGTYGIEFLPNGDIVYNAGSVVRRYNIATSTDSLFYSGVAFADGLSVTPDGHVIVADLSGSQILVLDSNGALVNSFSSSHVADGTAFGGGAIYKANTDGTLSRVDFSGPGFTGTGTETVIADGLLYSDLATVGPDNAFYITNLGAHYPDGYQAPFANGGLIRVSLVGGGGFGNEPPVTTGLPEPGSLALMAVALAGLAGAMRRRSLA